MIHTFLDPHVITCPSPSHGRDVFDAYIDNILLLFDVRYGTWNNITTSKSSCEAIMESGAYPLAPHIRASLEYFGSEDIQLQDVVSLTNWLLSNISLIEDEASISYVLQDEIFYEPNDLFISRDEMISAALDNLMGIHCLATTALPRDNVTNYLITRQIREDVESFSYRSKIHEVESEAEYATPLICETSMSLIKCRGSLFERVTPEAIWLSSQSDSDLEFALSGAVEAAQPQASGGTDSWKFGGNFIPTAQFHDFLTDPLKVRSLIRACVETICGTNLPATHALRENSGGNSKQITRGEDKAYRRDITHEYHLHYWDGPSGIELAVVVTHNNFDIPK